MNKNFKTLVLKNNYINNKYFKLQCLYKKIEKKEKIKRIKIK